jgi:hypothetical protein
MSVIAHGVLSRHSLNAPFLKQIPFLHRAYLCSENRRRTLIRPNTAIMKLTFSLYSDLLRRSFHRITFIWKDKVEVLVVTENQEALKGEGWWICEIYDKGKS